MELNPSEIGPLLDARANVIVSITDATHLLVATEGGILQPVLVLALHHQATGQQWRQAYPLSRVALAAITASTEVLNATALTYYDERPI